MTGETELRIGTRGSHLALWQARHVAERLARIPGAPPVRIVTIETAGDRIQDAPLSTVAGKGFFTKEIESALLDERVDLAVHSLKDLETLLPPGLALGAVLEREDPRDVWIGREGGDEIPHGARVGTSSLRRRALLARWRPDLRLLDLRGNVPTRVRKLDDGAFDAIVLAAAGIKRLGLAERISGYLPVDRVLPAVGQGAVAVQLRAGDARVLPWVGRLDHAATRAATAAERALLRRLEGGCQIPVGALAEVRRAAASLCAVICSPDGRRSVEGRREDSIERVDDLGRSLAEELLARGGAEILREVRGPSGGSAG